MSKQYNDYLLTHKFKVWLAYDYLLNLYSANSTGRLNIYHNLWQDFLIDHDNSKLLSQEYTAYDRYFYPNENDDEELVEKNYKEAWLHHIHNNPHHWQYWVLINDNDRVEALEMPKRYILELLCDWMSFDITLCSQEDGGSWFNAVKTKQYWDSHKKDMILHPKTRSSINYMINKLVKTYGEYGNVSTDLEKYKIAKAIMTRSFFNMISYE